MEKYNKLLVVSTFKKPKNKGFRVMANCICDCGNEVTVDTSNLRNGHTASCGCYKKEVHTTHGFYKHKLYKVWVSIKHRCYNSNNKSYRRYGFRGIRMAEEWINDAGAFINWSINNGWKVGLTIERSDNNGNYEPSNCKFIPKSEQTKNFSRNVHIEYNGMIKHVREWARYFNLDPMTISYRNKHGLPLDRQYKHSKKRPYF